MPSPYRLSSTECGAASLGAHSRGDAFSHIEQPTASAQIPNALGDRAQLRQRKPSAARPAAEAADHPDELSRQRPEATAGLGMPGIRRRWRRRRRRRRGRRTGHLRRIYPLAPTTRIQIEVPGPQQQRRSTGREAQFCLGLLARSPPASTRGGAESLGRHRPKETGTRRQWQHSGCKTKPVFGSRT